MRRGTHGGRAMVAPTVATLTIWRGEDETRTARSIAPLPRVLQPSMSKVLSMPRLARRLPLALLLAFAACVAGYACAGGSKAGDPIAAAASKPTPPTLLRGVHPELRIPPNSSTRTLLKVDVEVMVNASGEPDMATFKLSGPGADYNRDALRTWIAGSVFRPAQLDGHAVPGLFKIQIAGRRR